MTKEEFVNLLDIDSPEFTEFKYSGHFTGPMQTLREVEDYLDFLKEKGHIMPELVAQNEDEDEFEPV